MFSEEQLQERRRRVAQTRQPSLAHNPL